MKTAVEWLIEQILEIPLDNETNAAHLKKYVNKVSVFEKALKMEKNTIKEKAIKFAKFCDDNNIPDNIWEGRYDIFNT